MIDWLLAPIDLTRPHDVGALHAWHGRLMVLAWGVLVPLGVIIARFFKVLPRQRFPEVVENLFWWRTHLAAQGGALVLMAVGLVLVLWTGPGVSATAGAWVHHWLGWAILALGAAQGMSGLLRGTKGGPTDPRGSLRGDHYDMTRRRLVFERVHKTLGYAALALSLAAVMTGLWQANAPRWMWMSLSFWWGGLAAAFVIFQRRGMVVDTYVALWGPDPSHPGNARRVSRNRDG
ncbi:cytochrome b561 domain-containing protein [Jannaschia aquimarina]|uniref:Cytochrome b561 domain-containing protein n=1 Tax=Jannaschia aquimarina TaxID=935700 RepID=A0A0D1EAU8_9RHOB|nr:cytochrome b561 domain-containing protein [Jannaschia aquimarina]KIT14839.1 hypothetical protein jaqu_31640 [Jannaschia aquimarina]SNS57286.1 hypothetical protein SAMN05421775_101489 [Jannaschia aquimarina]